MPVDKPKDAQRVALLPCPFCGEKARVWSMLRFWGVECSNLNKACVSMPSCFVEMDDAIYAWNTRAQAPLVAAARLALEALKRASHCQFQSYYCREDGGSYLAGNDDAEYAVKQALTALDAALKGVE